MSATKERAEQVVGIMKMFDLVIESSKEGIRKPNPKIYELACERIGMAASEIVYLDDLGINLKPAKALGMTTIKVVSENQAIADLSEILKIDFQSLLLDS